jgi:hypothetical protein
MLSLRSDNDGKTIFFFTSSFEKLNGYVKQIIEVNTDHMGNVGANNGPSRITADFDKKGDLVQVRIAADLIMKFNTSYDSNGKRLTATGTYLAGQEIFQFDSNGRIAKSISKTVLDKESTGLVAQYKYDGNDDVVEIDILDPSGKVSIKTIFGYDDKHHLITDESVVKGQPGLKGRYQYLSFDQKDNWVKRIKIEEGIKDTITRKITYY